MFDIGEMVEQVIGGKGGSKGGDGVSIFGEAREAITGGCLGLLMSAGFFFAFYFTAFAWLTRADVYGVMFTAAGSPIIAFLCIAGLLSPFVGVFWGLRGGRYNIFQHIGCFGLTIIISIGIIVGLSL